MFKDSKIYVAGHTGMLGMALTKKLRENGYHSIVTKTHKELELTDRLSVDNFFREEMPEYVFNAAGLTGGIVANKTYPATFLHTNIAIQDSIFEAACKYQAKCLIFYGSSCVYPKNAPQPMKEEFLMSGDIESTSEAYAVAKMAGIIASRAYNIQFRKTKFISLIPNSMYGPHDNFDLENSHVLSALIRKFHDAKIQGKGQVVLWGSGNPRREFIFSEDVADASIFAILNSEKIQNQHYNIGTGEDYSIRDLAEMIAHTIGYEGNIVWDTEKPDGAPRKLLDSSKFRDLGWQPSIAFKRGLQETYSWFKKM